MPAPSDSVLGELSVPSLFKIPQPCSGSPSDTHTCYITEVRQPRASTALTAFSF